MPDVLIQLARPAADGEDTPVAGSVTCAPTARREVAEVVVLPQPFSARLVDGEVTVTLAQTGLTWCWRVTENVPAGITRYVAVPASAEVLDYADLTDVDPDTLDPAAEPEAAWTVALAENLAAIESAQDAAEAAQGLAEDARDAAVTAQGAAEVAQAAAEAAQDAAETAATAATAGLVLMGPTDPGTALPAGTEYVWIETDGAGAIVDIHGCYRVEE